MIATNPNDPTQEELAAGLEAALSDKDFVIDGVPATVDEVFVDRTGTTTVDTNAGMYSRDEWHRKILDGEIEVL